MESPEKILTDELLLDEQKKLVCPGMKSTPGEEAVKTVETESNKVYLKLTT